MVVKVGTSLTAAVLILTWMAVVDASAPSKALTVKASSSPLASCAPCHCNFSPVAKVVPELTASQVAVTLLYFCKVPELIASMRKDRLLLSISASLAAAAKSAKVISLIRSSLAPVRVLMVVRVGASLVPVIVMV